LTSPDKEKALRSHALEILTAGIDAVRPDEAVERAMHLDAQTLVVGDARYDLDAYDRVIVVGFGKASASMAKAVEEILDGFELKGLVVVKYGHLADLEKIRIVEAAHPTPDESGHAGAKEIAALLADAGETDLVLCLISGGGSALMPLPAAGISLADKKRTTDLLLECGARIVEINAVRKHISGIKGGQLARLAHPATVVSLMLSDVVGDPLDAIASGPTVPDPTTFAECIEIIDRYGIRDRCPKTVLDHLENGASGRIDETPKPGDPVFSGTRNLVIGSNAVAVKAAEKTARSLGYNTIVLSTLIEGETRDVAGVHTAIAREVIASGRPIKTPACLISGGETTVTIKGNGTGGRNQEFALAAAVDIAGIAGIVVLSAGTDGTDGPTDAAGALADGRTVARGQDAGLDAMAHLQGNDAYPFFDRLGDLIKTGPTNTNVMDLRVILVA